MRRANLSAQDEADATVRAIEARRKRAPLAAALEDRVDRLRFGADMPTWKQAEIDELDGVAMALADCGARGFGDIDAVTAQYWDKRLAEFEARTGAPALVVPEHLVKASS